MEPYPKKRVNKKYLQSPFNLHRVSKRTRQRWSLLCQQASECSVTEEESQNPNVYENRVDDKDQHPIPTETNNSEDSLNDDSDSSSDTSSCLSNRNYRDYSVDDSDRSSADDFDCLLNDNLNSLSNDESNCASDNNNHTKFNTEHLQGDIVMFPQSQLTISDVLLMITVYSVKKNLTKQDEDDLIDLVKVFAGPEFTSWNASQHARAKAYNPPKSKINTHFFCEACNVVLITHNNGKVMQPISTKCQSCQVEYKLTSESSNQFMIVDLDYQLELLLHEEKVQKDLLNTLNKLNESTNDGVIHNIFDSQLYKNLQRFSPQTLTYNLNTDGAPPFKSSNRSFWPIQLYLNELSAPIQKQNVILCGMFLTSTEPSPEFMKIYLSAFIDNATKLMTEGMNVTIRDSNLQRNFKFHCLLICVDSVARPVLQNRYQYSGYYGCSWCYAFGDHYNFAMRYPITENDPALRTHKDYIANVNEVERLGRHINGVKGRSELLRLKHFDVVWGFPLDYMHGVLLGVTRQLWTIWTTAKTSYYLTQAHREEINKRFLQIKRPHEIHRLVRPIKTMAKWKASEWESWLLFDSLPCLVGILNKECFDSYCLFVSSIFKLSSNNISERDIIQCELDLLQFVGECQQFYGKSAMTFNLHSLLHIGHSVRQSGPLFSSNTFIFESQIFTFKQEINAAHGVSHEIVTSTLKKNFIKCNIDNATESIVCRDYCKNLFYPKRLPNNLCTINNAILVGKANGSNARINSLILQHNIEENQSIKTFNRCIFKKIILRSIKYTRSKKTDDTVVQLTSKKIMRIHDFVVINNICYLYGRELLTAPAEFCTSRLTHIFQVLEVQGGEIFINIECLEAKLIFFTNGLKNYISILPEHLGI